MTSRESPPATPRRPDVERRPRGPGIAGRDRSRQAMFRRLLATVRSEGTLSADETAILERYGRALGVRAQAEPAMLERRRDFLDPGSIPETERADLLRIMVQIAYAHGGCGRVELDLLRRLAEMMGLSPGQFDVIRVSVEHQARRRRRTRLWLGVAVAVVVITVLAVVAFRFHRVDSGSGAVDTLIADTRKEIETLRERIDRLGVVDGPGHDARPIRETWEKMERLEARIEELERSGADASPLSEDLVAGSDRVTRNGWGTGFFVTSDGVIVTNKHVVQPWKFDHDTVELLDSGYRLDPRSIRTTAWTGGSSVYDESGDEDLDSAFSVGRGTLEIAAIAPDEYLPRRDGLSDGRSYRGRLHAQNDADLALLRAAVTAPVTPLPLAPDLEGVEKLDPVMVLGFPSGPRLLEGKRAETAPSLGEVRKVETSLFITAPIVPGNSGGPVIDQRGRVIGIASRAAEGEATMGACIQSGRAVALLQQLGD